MIFYLVGDGVGRWTGEVEEQHSAVLGAGRHAGPLAERQQRGDHGRPAWMMMGGV